MLHTHFRNSQKKTKAEYDSYSVGQGRLALLACCFCHDFIIGFSMRRGISARRSSRKQIPMSASGWGRPEGEAARIWRLSQFSHILQSLKPMSKAMRCAHIGTAIFCKWLPGLHQPCCSNHSSTCLCKQGQTKAWVEPAHTLPPTRCKWLNT